MSSAPRFQAPCGPSPGVTKAGVRTRRGQAHQPILALGRDNTRLMSEPTPKTCLASTMCRCPRSCEHSQEETQASLGSHGWPWGSRPGTHPLLGLSLPSREDG